MPAADEVWRLQTGNDPECRFFQRIAEKGHYGGRPGETRQGIYAIGPNGELLGSVNSTRPERVLAMMRAALATFEQLPPERRRLPEPADIRPGRRGEDRYPENGLVLQVISRDLTDVRDPAAPPGVKWNRDYAWFSAEEARQWFPGRTEVGHRFRVPAAQRLARFHFVDNVRGQTLAFHGSEVRTAALEAEVTAVREDVIELILRGETLTVCEGEWKYDERVFRGADGRWPRGVRTSLLGRARLDRKRQVVEELELVAVGSRWGMTRFNGRRRDTDPSPVGYSLTVAPRTPAARVAPAFLWLYGPEWR